MVPSIAYDSDNIIVKIKVSCILYTPEFISGGQGVLLPPPPFEIGFPYI